MKGERGSGVDEVAGEAGEEDKEDGVGGNIHDIADLRFEIFDWRFLI